LRSKRGAKFDYFAEARISNSAKLIGHHRCRWRKIKYVASCRISDAGRLSLSVQESPDKNLFCCTADAETVGCKSTLQYVDHYDSTLEIHPLANLFSIRSKDLSKPGRPTNSPSPNSINETRRQTVDDSISIAPQTY